MKVLICKEPGKTHSSSWSLPWEAYLKDNAIDYNLISLLEGNPIELIKEYDILLWHFGQYNWAEMLEARSILYSAKMMGKIVFPDFNDCWHFDDKIAEMYALQSIDAPIPKSSVYYSLESIMKDINSSIITYPTVAKLRSGSGSHNVKLIKNRFQLISYSRRMFGPGFNPAPSLLYKTSSNIRSSHNKETLIAKLKRAPEFLRTWKNAKRFPNEKGYVYLQEFIPNDGFDLKVVVVGDKLSGLYRPVRSHDFRASGGGEVQYNKEVFSKQIIESAFAAADAIGVKCIGFDYVVDNRTGEGMIVEMSYGFSHEAVMGMEGWFDRNCTWHNGALNAPAEILDRMINIK